MHAFVPRDIPSVPSESVETFCSSASICVATAALRSRSSLRCSSSALFSSMRATSAGDCDAVDADTLGPRICVDRDRVGYDMFGRELRSRLSGLWSSALRESVNLQRALELSARPFWAGGVELPEPLSRVWKGPWKAPEAGPAPLKVTGSCA
ncbi:hypothetical protein VFPBJ_05411 [Purpureocillium lilacinum]|nr:hypothetical protein VFPBJ_05411 [Purpureocillium lilacinum]